MDHPPFAELRRIAEYSTDSAAILDAIDALERAEPIAEAAREYERIRRAHLDHGQVLPDRKAAHDALIAAVDAERADTAPLTASEPPVSTTEPGVGRPYVSHGFTPSSGPFDPDRCRVQLSRYPCPDGRDAHDPSLPPEDVDAFGRIRRADLERGEARR